MKKTQIHMDNSTAQNSAKVMKRMEELVIGRLRHPPYSSNVSLSNFWFFHWNEGVMRDPRTDGPDHVRVLIESGP
jgi:hypothetical protein